MPLRIDTDSTPVRIVLEGIVTIEETDGLLEALAEHPGSGVDLSACEHLHTAPLQLLKIRKVPVVAPPADTFWLRCLEPFEESAPAPPEDAGEETDTEWGLFPDPAS